MTLAEYQTLTGITVPANQVAVITATLARATSMLETMLGYTLNPELRNTNFYNELGKTQNDCSCPPVDTETLLPADAVVNGYRLFDYNELDTYLWVDPYLTINKVKLVFIKQGAGTTGVTLKTFSVDQIRIHKGLGNLNKYLEKCNECFCSCDCTGCVQLAVDADWQFVTLPTDLQYVLVDMVGYYSNPKYKVKSESIDTHSYTLFDNTAPELEPNNLSVIKKYAGPNGSVVSMPTTGAVGRRWV